MIIEFTITSNANFDHTLNRLKDFLTGCPWATVKIERNGSGMLLIDSLIHDGFSQQVELDS